MKIRFFLILLIFGTIFSLGSVFFTERIPQYDLTISQLALQSSSDGYTVRTDNPQNIWYIGVSKAIIDKENNVCAIWKTGSQITRECLDFDGSDTTDFMYTFPVLTHPTTSISVELEGEGVSIDTDQVKVFAMNTAPQGYQRVWGTPVAEADPLVISRARWGADETIRYADSAHQKNEYAAYLKYRARSKTQSELDQIQAQTDRNEFLKKEGSATFKTMSLQRFENGHRLVWPIQKVQQVNRIILHHTAESLDRNLSDEEMIRGIYAYHAKTRGWGDIGYNYIVGQRGKIYEGRAGGGYVVGAHASYNNMGTAGVSVLGNYEKLHLNKDQESGLNTIISFLVKKYGITLSDEKRGYIPCKKGSDCYPIKVVKTKGLLGHQDVAITDCPGKNLYPEIAHMVAGDTKKYTPVLNTVQGTIDPLPYDEKMNLTLQNSTSVGSKQVIKKLPQGVRTKFSSSVLPRLYPGINKIKIRLSYPENLSSVTLSSLVHVATRFTINNKFHRLVPGQKIQVFLEGNDKLKVVANNQVYQAQHVSFTAPVVRVDNWKRVPEWDTLNKYNDNLFRDTIIVTNQNGKLLVVNRLPTEWYLKGLGEVSNNDSAEKVKTIVVAARTYAQYYMNPKNRKYHTSLYDGSDNPDEFQKYIGYGYELRSPRVANLVDATRGEKIYFGNEIIKPWYHSSSNGKTLSALEYCRHINPKNHCENIPYLQSVKDPGSVGFARSGHGVGISGRGATYFSERGWNYKKIIQYYLSGVDIHI